MERDVAVVRTRRTWGSKEREDARRKVHSPCEYTVRRRRHGGMGRGGRGHQGLVTRTLPGAPTRTALNALVTTDIVCVSLDASRAMPPPGDASPPTTPTSNYSSVDGTNPFCICTEYFATGDTRLPLALEDWGRDDCIRVLTRNFSPRLPFASRPILTTPRRLSPRLLIGRSAAVVVVDAHRGLQYGSRDDSDDSGRRDRGARRERASAVGG